MKRVTIGAVAAAAIASVGASAQAGYQPASAQAPRSAALVTTVKVTAKDIKFVLDKKTAKRGVVIFKVKNVGLLKHDFQIKGRKTKLLSHGQSDTLRISFLRKGSYPYKCTVKGHAAAGMKGVFTIT